MLLFLIFFSACSPSTVNPQATSVQATETNPPESTPSPSATLTPPKTLTICTASLPDNLFPFTALGSISKKNLLQMIYEQAFSQDEGGLVPVIVNAVPSQSKGDLRLEPVLVQGGQPVVDANGQLVNLKPGVQVRPGGCRDSECVIVWDGEADLEMDRMVINYKMIENLTWSDGSPVTSEDSVFSFEMANFSEDPGLNWAKDRTHNYTSIDGKTVQWVGKPGFTTADLSRFFWLPLPSYLFDESENYESLLNNEALNKSPVSYGPYIISDWGNDLLRFSRNPYYFREDEGLPRLDQIEIQRIDGSVSDAWEALQTGDCDVLDSSFNWTAEQDLLPEIQADDRVDVLYQTGDSWMQLVFGINPASYDDFYNPDVGDRPDFLGNPQTRQALMSCLDRESMLALIFDDFSQVWPSYLPTGLSQLNPDEEIGYDPASGAELLDAVGWLDYDGIPETPRQAWNVPGIPTGSSLSLELLIGNNVIHQALAGTIEINLEACGVEIMVKTLPLESIYAPGPEGLLFGRQFDLALLSWQPKPGGDCQFYQSWAIPEKDNYWIGTNIAGLSNEAYDRACGAAVLALPEERVEAVRRSELVYLDDLPAVPLFSPPRIMALPANACSENEISSEEEFFGGISTFGSGEMCP